MGEQWLSDVTTALRDAGWAVEAGYPGAALVLPQRPVAAVNLSRGNTRDSSAGITVSVLVPRTQGLTLCQSLASQAAVLLSGVGGDWSFEGWSYDSTMDCFRVEVEGEASFLVQDDTQILDEGYEILIGESAQINVTAFTAKKDAQRRLLRSHGRAVPVGVTPGVEGWSIELVQLLPSGLEEPEETADGFTLTVRRGGKQMRYLDCCWDQYESRQRQEGIQILRRGFALSREEG